MTAKTSRAETVIERYRKEECPATIAGHLALGAGPDPPHAEPIARRRTIPTTGWVNSNQYRHLQILPKNPLPLSLSLRIVRRVCRAAVDRARASGTAGSDAENP